MEDKGQQVVQNFLWVRNSLPEKVKLVVVSKHQPVEVIKLVYEAGQRIFGENRIQELMDKKARLPADIEWHFIGNLQSNKVKYIAPFISLIQSAGNDGLLDEISRQAKKNNRNIDCLLEVHIASEVTKHGYSPKAADELLTRLTAAEGGGPSISAGGAKVIGLMGMATHTADPIQVRKEFHDLALLYKKHETALDMRYLSMGMTGDYRIAIEEGSNMVRIGSLIFGTRQ